MGPQSSPTPTIAGGTSAAASGGADRSRGLLNQSALITMDFADDDLEGLTAGIGTLLAATCCARVLRVDVCVVCFVHVGRGIGVGFFLLLPFLLLSLLSLLSMLLCVRLRLSEPAWVVRARKQSVATTIPSLCAWLWLQTSDRPLGVHYLRPSPAWVATVAVTLLPRLWQVLPQVQQQVSVRMSLTGRNWGRV